MGVAAVGTDLVRSAEWRQVRDFTRTLVLALGLAAETHPDRWPALMRRRHSGHFGRGDIRPGLRHHQVAAS